MLQRVFITSVSCLKLPSSMAIATRSSTTRTAAPQTSMSWWSLDPTTVGTRSHALKIGKSAPSDPCSPGVRRGFFRVFSAWVLCSRSSSVPSALASLPPSLLASPFSVSPRRVSLAFVPRGCIRLCCRLFSPSGGFGWLRVAVLSSLLDPVLPGVRRGFFRVFLIWSSR